MHKPQIKYICINKNEWTRSHDDHICRLYTDDVWLECYLFDQKYWLNCDGGNMHMQRENSQTESSMK